MQPHRIADRRAEPCGQPPRGEQLVPVVDPLVGGVVGQVVEEVTEVVEEGGGDEAVGGAGRRGERRRLEGVLELRHRLAAVFRIAVTCEQVEHGRERVGVRRARLRGIGTAGGHGEPQRVS
jgi:hypothetical protein